MAGDLTTVNRYYFLISFDINISTKRMLIMSSNNHINISTNETSVYHKYIVKVLDYKILTVDLRELYFQ